MFLLEAVLSTVGILPGVDHPNTLCVVDSWLLSSMGCWERVVSDFRDDWHPGYWWSIVNKATSSRTKSWNWEMCDLNTDISGLNHKTQIGVLIQTRLGVIDYYSLCYFKIRALRTSEITRRGILIEWHHICAQFPFSDAAEWHQPHPLLHNVVKSCLNPPQQQYLLLRSLSLNSWAFSPNTV